MRLLLFFLFPAVELYFLVTVGARIGALNMVAWVVLSAALGVWVLREQGRSVLRAARADVASGRVPPDSILQGLSVFLAGILLILPGLITDVMGLILLLPFARKVAGIYLLGWMGKRQTVTRSANAPGGSGIFFMKTGGFDNFGGGPSPSSGDFSPHATVIDCTPEVSGSGREAGDRDER